MTLAIVPARGGEAGQCGYNRTLVFAPICVMSIDYGFDPKVHLADLLRAAGATERLMELLGSRSPVADPATPRPLPRASSEETTAVLQ